MRSDEKIYQLYIGNKWIFLVFLIPFFCVTSFSNINFKILTLFCVTFLLYCVLGKQIMIKNRAYYNGFKNVIPYIDTIFCGIAIFLSSGLASDIFIIFIFLIVFYSTFESKKTGFRICILSIFTYTLCCVAFIDSISIFFLGRLIIRLSVLIITLIIVDWFNNRLDLLKKNLEKEKLGARKDTLTGLWNRKMLDEMLVKVSSEYKFNDRKRYGILIIDLDDFKSINDGYGHDKGDFVLENVAYGMNSNIAKKDMLFRIGGDEFLILIRDCDEFKLRLYADRIKNSISRIRFNFGDSLTSITVSIGGSLSNEGDFEKMYKLSDERMYDGKNNGKNMGVTC